MPPNNLKPDQIRQRLIKESQGSFSIVHRALVETRRKSESGVLDIEDVVSAIRRQLSPCHLTR